MRDKSSPKNEKKEKGKRQSRKERSDKQWLEARTLNEVDYAALAQTRQHSNKETGIHGLFHMQNHRLVSTLPKKSGPRWTKLEDSGNQTLSLI